MRVRQNYKINLLNFKILNKICKIQYKKNKNKIHELKALQKFLTIKKDLKKNL